MNNGRHAAAVQPNEFVTDMPPGTASGNQLPAAQTQQPCISAEQQITADRMLQQSIDSARSRLFG
ncbi:MAG TPA: hypothetical protein DCX79_16500, partial [Planctomycetaceae bacterium]|nr:hypothetical protein [Planctomycetaceae bacterium]